MKKPPNLTMRERQVLPNLLNGATRVEIASDLGISPETVKLHVRNLLQKFDAINLRDGFERMSDYNKYYNPDDNQICHKEFHILEEISLFIKGPFVTAETNVDVLVMGDEVKTSYYAFDSDAQCCELLNVRSNFPLDSRDMNIQDTYNFQYPKPFKQGEEFTHKIEVDLDFSDAGPKKYFKDGSVIPSETRRIKIEFDPSSPPKSFSVDVSLGLATDPTYILRQEKTKNGVIFHDDNPRVPVLYLIQWEL